MNKDYNTIIVGAGSIGDIHGRQYDRDLWEKEYYFDILNRLRVK